VHVFEESDSGTVPMNHSNKSGRPPAESEEGRPLIKENTHQSSTLSTQSEVGVTVTLGNFHHSGIIRFAGVPEVTG
jgi:RNA-directed DNA polymerase